MLLDRFGNKSRSRDSMYVLYLGMQGNGAHDASCPGRALSHSQVDEFGSLKVCRQLMAPRNETNRAQWTSEDAITTHTWAVVAR